MGLSHPKKCPSCCTAVTVEKKPFRYAFFGAITYFLFFLTPTLVLVLMGSKYAQSAWIYCSIGPIYGLFAIRQVPLVVTKEGGQ
jgi:hypothetical protein